MSYDVWLDNPARFEHEQSGECARMSRLAEAEDPPRWWHDCVGCSVEVGNITYNISPMFHDALGFGEGVGANGVEEAMGWNPDTDRRAYGLARLNGAPAVEAAGLLAEAVSRMRLDPAHYRAMNSPNGWGTYEDALGFIERLYLACVEHPAHRIVVS